MCVCVCVRVSLCVGPTAAPKQQKQKKEETKKKKIKQSKGESVQLHTRREALQLHLQLLFENNKISNRDEKEDVSQNGKFETSTQPGEPSFSKRKIKEREN